MMPTPLTAEQQHEIEKLHPWNEAAWLTALGPAPTDSEGSCWDDLEPAIQLHWTRIADAVLDRYDPEYRNNKAGW